MPQPLPIVELWLCFEYRIPIMDYFNFPINGNLNVHSLFNYLQAHIYLPHNIANYSNYSIPHTHFHINPSPYLFNHLKNCEYHSKNVANYWNYSFHHSNTILILHNVFPYCAIDYLCCASDYSFFYSIYALNTANNWIQITFWVPNLHITLLLIQSNVTFFSQCSAVFFWKSVHRSRWPHVE